ncbi:MAG: ATP-grasp domain-containing protein, partial [Rhodocyclaceae bacterium]|nr:ATP-grasp domain-containing protein [Rhodocyclaceae bacterium]
MVSFRKILIANRGEIVARVARTARRMGYATAAVHSDADSGAPFVAACDEAVGIGGLSPADSYLRIDAIIDACRRSGADAVHPGYGFLSENAAFARACADAGLLFIGPPAEAIEAMGDKAAARRRMDAAGVPCIPGYDGKDQDDERLTAEAGRIGFPLMVKAAAGGGGRGMRRVHGAGELPAALASARSEARSAFGDGTLILERLLVGARHVEVQVFADTLGGTVHLFERDCSVQRRHQKVIEEAPSPAVDAALRERLGRAACAAARAVGYVGAGTVEFLLGADGQFHFMEMNTRLQVEHPVTEAITGLDLVEWQLRVAAGEPLPLAQSAIPLTGHGLEVRLYAEDPERGFLPQTGRLLRWRPSGRGRCDHALAGGVQVTPHYDPMLAKVVAHGRDREEARRRLIAALRDTVVLGLTTNKAFLLGCLEHPEFAAGRATTDFVAAHFADATPVPPAREAVAAAALLFYRRGVAALPQPALAGWHSGGNARYHLELDVAGERRSLTLRPTGHGLAIEGAGEPMVATDLGGEDERLCLELDGLRLSIPYAFAGPDRLHLDVGGRDIVVEEVGRRPPRSRE